MGIFGGAKPDPLPAPIPLPPAAHPATLGSQATLSPQGNKGVAGLTSTIATTPGGLQAPPDKAKTTLLGG